MKKHHDPYRSTHRHKSVDFQIVKKPINLQSHTPSQQTHSQKKSSSKLKTIILVIAAGILLGFGIYILNLLLTPRIYKKSAQQIIAQQEKDKNSNDTKNMLYIPSAGVAAEIAEGSVNVLDQGKVWHRLPYIGDPHSGGNTILTGHSFVWGYTPSQIKKKSIFYSLSDAKVGDEVIVRWNKKDYHYKIEETKTVKPNEVSIEQISREPRLTIYTCTLAGSADGRVVLIAKPI